jgi:hypothetical protein
MEVYVNTPNQETNPTTEFDPKESRPAATKAAAKRKNTASKDKPATLTKKSARKVQPVRGSQSKQDRVVAMLQRPEGTTVAAVMKATGWQKHSVHGFFAGVVRKKLGLNIISAGTDGKRIYRVVDAKGSKRAKTAASSRKRAA